MSVLNCAVYVIVCVLTIARGSPLVLKDGAYEGLVVSVSDVVPVEDCKAILESLEITLNESSQFLYDALDSRSYFGSITVLLPGHWPSSCVPKNKAMLSSNGEQSDITITGTDPIHKDAAWTLQTAGCGQPGEQIYFSYASLNRSSLKSELVREWAKYRYGVFDERGYKDDPIYPMCYTTDSGRHVIGCSDQPLNDKGICDNMSSSSNIIDLVQRTARTSIMFAAEAPGITMFCDEGTHDKYAPTKHNHMCNGRSTIDVILQHKDFIENTIINTPNPITNTTPTITYKKQTMTRYVLVVEDTKDMSLRESWSFLRNAIRKWAVYDLASNTEVGLVLANETSATKLLNISSLSQPASRDLVASNIPYTPGDSRAPACLHCAIKEALAMLQDSVRVNGPANSVILIIAPGLDNNVHLSPLIQQAKKSHIRISTVNYPGILRQQPLDYIAKATNGIHSTVHEHKYNMATSLLSTYFRLTNVLYNIAVEYYQGSPSDLEVEIYQRELVDDGRHSVTGSFVLNSAMGEPASFTVFTHNTENPLIRLIKLVSPSGIPYSTRSDRLLNVRQLTLSANINETGSWTYTIERFPGNPQPQYVQVRATPRSASVPVIGARAWLKASPNSPAVIYTKVTRGNRPILSARVEVIARLVQYNGTVTHTEKFDILDTGSGDPDITKGDGVYSRYFNAGAGPGMYIFEITVTDNGNTAYSLRDMQYTSDADPSCCGSMVSTPSKQPLSPFQRVLPPITVTFTNEEIMSQANAVVGRIGDLRAEIFPDDFKAKLMWTSPDMGGVNVARYEIKYAFSLEEIVNHFDTSAHMWEHGVSTLHAFALGSETTFTLNMLMEPKLLGKALYFGVRAISHFSANEKIGPVSNWARVFVPSPPPPPTIPPTYTDDTPNAPWPHSNNGGSDSDPMIPRLAQNVNFGLEVILPIVGGIAFLATLLAIYCYFCVIKRRTGGPKKSVKHSNMKSNKLNTSGTMSQSPNHLPSSTPQSYNHDMADHHTIGLPMNCDPNMDDEPKKRYSLVHQQEQQLVEELKQQQRDRDLMVTPNIPHQGLSIISNNNLGRNGRTLSPYESWTASQLLHEHERRHSPLDEMFNQSGDRMMVSHQDQVSLMNEQIAINSGTLQHHDPNISIRQEHMMYHQLQMAPPVPPLPTFSANGYPVNYQIYGVNGNPTGSHAPPMYSAIKRNDSLVPFNPSLQGSLNSVNSGDKKRRNVTMV